MPTPLRARCSGFWEKRLCWISLMSAGIAQRSPASSPACPTTINHAQGQACQFPLFVRLFSSLFFALPKLTARLIQSGQRDVSGEALPFKGAIQGRRKQKKRLSSKSLELFANNNTALTEQPKIRWAECVRAAATPPEWSEGMEQRCPRGCLSFPEPRVMPKA